MYGQNFFEKIITTLIFNGTIENRALDLREICILMLNKFCVAVLKVHSMTGGKKNVLSPPCYRRKVKGSESILEQGEVKLSDSTLLQEGSKTF